MSNMIKRFVKKCINKVLFRRKALYYVNIAHNYLQTKLCIDCSLTKEECKLVDELWGDLRSNIGSKTYDWHKFYKGFVEKFDARYIPSDIYNPIFEYTLNERRYSIFLQHKSMLRNFIKKENRIGAIVDLIDGVFYDDNLNILTQTEARQIIKDEANPIIIKPSIGSGGGQKVEYFKKGAIINLNNYIGNGDYTFQHFFEEGDDLKRFNPDTVNTIRMITLNLNGKCTVLSSFLRIGQEGMKVDNLSAGGMLIGIDENGKLADYALDKNLTKFYESPSGLKFKNLKLSSYRIIADYAINNHPHIPLAKLIAWDFAVDSKNSPIVIEINLDSGEIQFHQIYNGPLFGERTAEVIKYIKEHPLKRFTVY